MCGEDTVRGSGGSNRGSIDRRRFLQAAGAGAGATFLPATAGAADGTIDATDWASSTDGRPSALTTDDDGWTVLDERADTRKVYVSSSAGDDANEGTSPDDPVETLEAGIDRLRDGYPDWLLLKSGDVWRDEDLEALVAHKSGRSDTERLVVTSYDDGPRPRIETTRVAHAHQESWRNVAIVGVDFYAYSADPDNPAFEDSADTGFVLVEMRDLSNVLFEDCRVRFFGYGFSLSGNEVGDLSAIEFRRCIVTDCWSDGSYDDDEKSQGMWNSNIDGFLVEETLWDHNGHNDDVDGAGPNMYNHNLYMDGANDDVAVRRNVFARGAAQGLQLRAGGVCHDNLFVRNAVGMNVGYQGDINHDAHVFDNVVLEGRLMDPDNSDWPRTGALWGIWDASDPAYDVLIEDNIVAHALHENGVHAGINREHDESTVRDNVVYDWDEDQDMWNEDWPDPERSVADYHTSIGGEASLEAFLQGARARGPGEWLDQYAAPAVNDYVRAGFGMAEEPDVPEEPNEPTETPEETETDDDNGSDPTDDGDGSSGSSDGFGGDGDDDGSRAGNDVSDSGDNGTGGDGDDGGKGNGGGSSSGSGNSSSSGSDDSDDESDDGGSGAESQDDEADEGSDGSDREHSETAVDQSETETTSSDAGAAREPTDEDTETDSTESAEASDPGEDDSDNAPAGMTGPGFGVVSGVVGAAGGAVLATRRLLDGDSSNGDCD